MHGYIPDSSKQKVLQSNETSETRVTDQNTPGTSLSSSSKLHEPVADSIITTELRQCECISETNRHCLPFSQVVFLTQLTVIFILDAFCLLKLIFSQTESNTRQSPERNNNSCHDTSVYMSILSSTLAYLIPPPRIPVRIQKTKAQRLLKKTCQLTEQPNQIATKHVGGHHDQQSSGESIGEISAAISTETESQIKTEDIPDCGDLAEATSWYLAQNKQPRQENIRPSGDSACDLEKEHELWRFFNWQMDRNLFIFSSQITFVIVLVLFSVSRILLVSSLNCEERTAHFMILSTCVAYLLPNADNFN